MLSGFLLQMIDATAQIDLSYYPDYTGTDLGMSYSLKQTSFKIWAPTASEAQIVFYSEGIGGKEISRSAMTKNSNGVWNAFAKADLKGKFYAFRVKINGEWKNEVTDPYVKIVGVNGKRGMIADLKQTNPAAFF